MKTTTMARKKLVRGTNKTKLIADQAIALADYATKVLVAAEHLRIRTKDVEGFPLQAPERTTLARLPALPAKIKEKMAKKGGFSIAEVASMGIAVADSFVEAEPGQQMALLLIAKKLMNCLQANIIRPNLHKGKRA